MLRFLKNPFQTHFVQTFDQNIDHVFLHLLKSFVPIFYCSLKTKADCNFLINPSYQPPRLEKCSSTLASHNLSWALQFFYDSDSLFSKLAKFRSWLLFPYHSILPTPSTTEKCSSTLGIQVIKKSWTMPEQISRRSSIKIYESPLHRGSQHGSPAFRKKKLLRSGSSKVRSVQESYIRGELLKGFDT